MHVPCGPAWFNLVLLLLMALWGSSTKDVHMQRGLRETMSINSGHVGVSELDAAGCRAPAPPPGVSNTGVNGKLLHLDSLSPFLSLHLSFPSRSLSSLPSPLQVGPLIAARESGGALKLPQWVRAKPGRQTPSAAFSAYLNPVCGKHVHANCPCPHLPLSQKFLNQFAIISGPGLETVGGGQLPPFASPRGDANGSAHV